MNDEISTIIEDRKIIICCGSGGVGKTTVAAAFGVACAMTNRRVCVVTIDPARRLADALGIGQMTDAPTRIDVGSPGELFAVMLDAKQTFDELVRRHAQDPEQAERILSNRLYRNLAPSLAGTQEYMASEKLYELHESGQFDVIVVDTPPTRAALDFLNAPSRLTAFINNRVFRTLIGTSGYARVLGVATQALLRPIARVAGTEIVEDAVAFFQAFSGMEEGFKERATQVSALLHADTTSYVLVTTPRREAIDEALEFVGLLASAHHGIDAVVINRKHPDFGPPIAPAANETVLQLPWHELVTNLADLSVLSSKKEEQLLADLADKVGAVPSASVPIFPTDVHDLEALTSVARYLTGDDVPFPRGQDPRRYSDAQTVRNDIRAVVDDGDNVIVELSSGEQVRGVAAEDPPDLVIADSQIQNMGGIVVLCMDIKLEESGGRLPFVPVLLLLDRRADVFIAKRSGSEGFLIKPLDPIRIRKAVSALLDGQTYYDTSYTPVTVGATH